MSRIPLVDLRAQAVEIAEEVRAGFTQVIESGSFVFGREVAEFEAAFAEFSGARHCVGVASGTDAVELAVRALGIGRGDEVIVPANTFIATAAAVERAGASTVLVDVDARYQLVDPAQVAERISPRTRAVVAVHLFGQMAPMEVLLEICRSAGLALIEDAAQAQGARRHGAGPGVLGAIAATSFYPGKNLGAYGDAGAVLTGSDDLAARVRALRNHGSEVKYHHPVAGFNSRLDTLQAVVLSAKLKRLERWNDARRAAAARYDMLLRSVPRATPPSILPGNDHVFHLYVVRVPRRDGVLAALRSADIGAGIHYPIPIHLQGAFSHLGHRRGDFPETERAADEVLSLPLYPEIRAEDQAEVVDVIRRALA